MAKRKLISKSQSVSAVASRAEESMGTDLSHYVTTMQAAEILGVDHSQAARLLKASKLKGVTIGLFLFHQLSSIVKISRKGDDPPLGYPYH